MEKYHFVWVRTHTGLSPQIWSSDCFDRPASQLAGVLLDHHPMSAASRFVRLVLPAKNRLEQGQKRQGNLHHPGKA